MPQQLDLRDIHLPDAISWWPPAIGWWLVLLLLVLVIGGAYTLFKKWRQDSAVKGASKLLANIKQQADGDKLQTIRALSVCLRRLQISDEQRAEVASLHGQAWLQYLDGFVEGKPFSEGIGRCLADAPYQPALTVDVDIEALINLCERCVKGQTR